jgi:HEPN domain-containing protein
MMTQQEIVDFWIKTSDMNFNDMEGMFLSKHYDWALFVGHLLIEKLLKALFVKVNGKDVPVPKIHDLSILAKRAQLEINEEQKLKLSTFTEFNINTRYQNYKFDFYKRCTKEYSANQIKDIKEIRQWLKTLI